MDTERYLQQTPILDHQHPSIAGLIEARGWAGMEPFGRIGAAYDYVRNEVAFGYNLSDDIPASAVLRDGYGQCNTKGSLLMALLRGVGIPCRFHGFTIDKALQKGAMTGVVYRFAPRSIIHSWVEVLHEGSWIDLEGFILDQPYLDKLRELFPDVRGSFCGYGVAIAPFEAPPVEWKGECTYIQKDGIDGDFGIFSSPDEFYERHGTNTSGFRELLFALVGRRLMNRNVARVRAGMGQVVALEQPLGRDGAG